MNTRHILYPVLLSAVLLAACSDNDRLPGNEPDTGTPATQSASVQFTAALPTQARTSYEHTDGPTPGFTVKWKGKDTYSDDADQIAIIVAWRNESTAIAGADAVIYHPDQSSTSSALAPADEGITGLQTNTAYDFYAYYPYGGEGNRNIQGSVKDFEAQEQNAPDNTDHLAAYDFMYAKAENITYTGKGVTGIDFAFTHAMTFVQVDVTNDLSKGDLTVRKLHLSLADGSKEILIPLTVDLNSGSISSKSVARQTLTVTSPAATGKNNTSSYRMAIAPGYKGKIMRITVEAAEGEYTRNLAAPAEGFEAGKNYVLSLKVTESPTDATNEKWTTFISNATELNDFRNAVNGGDNYEGKTVALSANIDLSGETWDKPIGIYGKTFKGTFDGRGYTISNLSVTTDEIRAGLFGGISGAKILNVHIGGTINHTYNTSGGGNAGGICGWASNSEISDCSFAGRITGHGRAGGIAGTTASTPVTACRNTAAVSSTGMSDQSLYFGGIVGYASGKITACYNTGNVEYTGSSTSKQQNIGGICGWSSSKVTACYNTGTVNGTGTDYIGSISASSNSRSGVTACYAAQLYTYSTANSSDYGDNPNGVKVFSATVWPDATVHAAWNAASGADGSENHYWKSLGSWTTDLASSTLPRLWWEKD